MLALGTIAESLTAAYNENKSTSPKGITVDKSKIAAFSFDLNGFLTMIKSIALSPVASQPAFLRSRAIWAAGRFTKVRNIPDEVTLPFLEAFLN
jgi:hypothetical protein